MKKIHLTKDRYAIVDDDDFEYLNRFKWHLHESDNDGLKYYKAAREVLRHTIFMEYFILSIDTGTIAHINKNTLDYRKENLIGMTRGLKTNSARRGRTAQKSKSKFNSRFKGVCRRPDVALGCWQARITYNKKRIHLGTFGSEIDAALAYNKASLDFFGPMAYQNKI